MGIFNRTLKPSHAQKHTRLKIHNILALPTLLYGCETWAIREHNKSRKTSAEIKCMRKMAKYTWQNYRTNEDIYHNLKLAQL
jgi:hypothetical protein